MAKKKSKKKKTKREFLKVGEAELFGKLKKRFSPPQWAIFRHVRDSTGFQGKRTADAVAMGLWPSQGMEVHGFEIKISRGDWMRELAQPEKSAPVQKYCDRWWIVVSDASIVDTESGELPKTWGLLAVKGGKLHTVVEAPRLKAKKLSRGFVAFLLRRAYEANQVPDLEQQIREELRDEIERSVVHSRDYEKRNLKRMNEELTMKVNHYEEMAKISGVQIHDWNYKEIAQAIGLIQGHGRAALLRRLENTFQLVDTVHGQMKGALDELRDLEKE